MCSTKNKVERDTDVLWDAKGESLLTIFVFS